MNLPHFCGNFSQAGDKLAIIERRTGKFLPMVYFAVKLGSYQAFMGIFIRQAKRDSQLIQRNTAQ